MRGAAFIKMHGLGNDFVVLDLRRDGPAIDAAAARALADRRRGVGCDQVVLIERPPRADAAAFMRIRNADGGEAEACGNAARCVAALLMDESGSRDITLDTAAGLIAAHRDGPGQITVDMGAPRLEWHDVPLARAADTLHVPLAAGPLADAVCTGMGNPHATFFVADADAVDLAALGPGLERDAIFPERANIGVAQVLGRDRIRLRVWERGAGITPACGTGACAALVAAHRRGLAGRRAEVHADGGMLIITWRDDGHVMMTGPAAVSFRGTLEPALLAAG
jgi:diaminopimelate epimerase